MKRRATRVTTYSEATSAGGRAGAAVRRPAGLASRPPRARAETVRTDAAPTRDTERSVVPRPTCVVPGGTGRYQAAGWSAVYRRLLHRRLSNTR